MFVRKLFDSCQLNAIPPEEMRVDPGLAAPNVLGGDFETYEKQMDDWHEKLSGLVEGDDPHRLRPVPRSSEPALKITAKWGAFRRDPVKASRLAAIECMMQLDELRKKALRKK